MKKTLLSLLALFAIALPATVNAGHDVVNTVAAQGYDVVSYQQGTGEPLKGNGNHVAYHDGATFLFSSDENKKLFEASPAKYAPAYGGYCAYGVALGKKFVGDPLAYKVVDGTLYLNLNKDIQSKWLQDVPGNITKGNGNWNTIKDKHPADL